MKRIAFCAACQQEQHGIKSRVAIPHTCGKDIKGDGIKRPKPKHLKPNTQGA